MLKNVALAVASIVVSSAMFVPNTAVAKEASYDYWCYSGGKVLFSGTSTASAFSNVADACRASGGQMFSRPSGTAD